MSVDISSWYIIYKIPEIIDNNHFHIKFFTSVKFDINKFYIMDFNLNPDRPRLSSAAFFSLQKPSEEGLGPAATRS